MEVAQAPRGSTVEANLTTESGSDIRIDLGGGVVSEGGRVIKASKALDDLLEELEWALLESDVSSDAVSGVVDALRDQLIGARLRRGADLSKVLEASLKRALRSLLEAGYWDFDATVSKALEAGDTGRHHARGRQWNRKDDDDGEAGAPVVVQATRSSLRLATPSEPAPSSSWNSTATTSACGASRANAAVTAQPLLGTPSLQRRPRTSTSCWSTPLEECRTKRTS